LLKNLAVLSTQHGLPRVPIWAFSKVVKSFTYN